MKTRKIYGIIVTLLVMISMVSVTSCGHKAPDAAAVAARIDAQEKLSQADYATVLDYCGEYARKAQQYFDLINRQPNDSTAEYIRAANDMAALTQEYPYLDMFRGVVYNIQQSDLDASNRKKVEEYAGYQAFPLPGGAGADLANPEVTGDIVDMPTQAGSDSTGVIATGDGETVDVNVAD